MIRIEVLSGAEQGRTDEAAGPAVTIGRDPSCQWRFAASGDLQVSGHHARVSEDGNAFVVEDLGSTNGTWVAGRRIDGPVHLAAGGEISLGRHGPRLRLSRPAPEARDVPKTTFESKESLAGGTLAYLAGGEPQAASKKTILGMIDAAMVRGRGSGKTVARPTLFAQEILRQAAALARQQQRSTLSIVGGLLALLLLVFGAAYLRLHNQASARPRDAAKVAAEVADLRSKQEAHEAAVEAKRAAAERTLAELRGKVDGLAKQLADANARTLDIYERLKRSGSRGASASLRRELAAERQRLAEIRNEYTKAARSVQAATVQQAPGGAGAAAAARPAAEGAPDATGAVAATVPAAPLGAPAGGAAPGAAAAVPAPAAGAGTVAAPLAAPAAPARTLMLSSPRGRDDFRRRIAIEPLDCPAISVQGISRTELGKRLGEQMALVLGSTGRFIVSGRAERDIAAVRLERSRTGTGRPQVGKFGTAKNVVEGRVTQFVFAPGDQKSSHSNWLRHLAAFTVLAPGSAGEASQVASTQFLGRGSGGDGTLAGLTVDLEFDVRDLATGEVLFTVEGQGATASRKTTKSDAAAAGDPATDALRKALYEAAIAISRRYRELSVPWRGTVLAASADQVVLSLGTEDRVRPGDTFQVRSKGKVLIEQDSGMPYNAAETVVGTVRVDHVDGDTSVARVIDRQAPFKNGDAAVFLGTTHEVGSGGDGDLEAERASRTAVVAKPGTAAFAGPGRSFAVMAADAGAGGHPLQLLFAFPDWIAVALADGKTAWLARDATSLKLAGADAP